MVEHPNELLVKENGHREYVKPDPIGRRDYMKALALAGGTVLAGSALTAEEAMAAVADGSPKIEFGDAASDPAANGVMARNGTDVKVFTGGALKNLSDIGGGGGLTTKVISDTDSPYTTQDEDIIYVDESAAAVTVRLATADATEGNEIEVVNLTGTNTVTVDTEGAETIDPGGESSKAITKAGWNHAFTSDGTNWSAGFGLADQTNNTVDFPDSASANDGCMAIGPGSSATNTGGTSVAVGPGITAVNNAFVLGAGTTEGEGGGTVIGIDALGGNNGTVIGYNNNANNGTAAVSIGRDVSAFGNDSSVFIGTGISASNVNDQIAIGQGVSIGTNGLARIGLSQLVFGGVQDTVADADLNNSELTIELDETNNAFRLRGKDSGGTVREATVAW